MATKPKRPSPDEPGTRSVTPRRAIACLAGVAAVVFGGLLAGSSVPSSHEPADLPVPRRLSYGWMSAGQWLGHHERLLEAASADSAGVRLLWLGDSITEWWPRIGADSWETLWQPRGSLNLALGGDSTQHLLWRLHHGAIDGLEAEVVVLAIGTNNLHLSGHSDQQVVAGVVAVVAELHQRLPDADVIVSGILPRGRRPGNALRSRIQEINAALARELHGIPGVHFIDAGAVMLEPDGSIGRPVMRDYLHLTEEGYRRWAAELLPVVDGLLPTQAD